MQEQQENCLQEGEQVSIERPQKPSFWKRQGAYWKDAGLQFANVKMLVFAACICALRIAVKLIRVPIIPGVLNFTFDAYVNALGSLVYGPLVALLVGAISDTVGAIFFPSGPYFFPYIFIEMSSSFIFALFFWRKKLTAPKAILAKFTVNFICNIILTSLVMKWQYAYFGTEGTYSFFNLSRIVKNLVLAPLEGTLIVVILNALLPVLRRFKFAKKEQQGIKLTWQSILLIVVLTALSVAIVLFYVFFLRDWIKANNIKFW